MSQRIGGIKGLLRTPHGLRRGINLWPPLLFSGIRVESISADWREMRVVLAKSRLTSNYFGTQFGGSMFAMVDPFFVILLTRLLGPGYVVWDQRGEIDFVRPGRTALTAQLSIPAAEVDEIRAAAADGAKVLHWFACELTDASGEVVARIRKQIYVRRKR
ncbi:MAG: DUF4442 domain-containing protein [Nocardioides sp.]